MEVRPREQRLRRGVAGELLADGPGASHRKRRSGTSGAAGENALGWRAFAALHTALRMATGASPGGTAPPSPTTAEENPPELAFGSIAAMPVKFTVGPQEPGRPSPPTVWRQRRRFGRSRRRRRRYREGKSTPPRCLNLSSRYKITPQSQNQIPGVLRLIKLFALAPSVVLTPILCDVIAESA